MMEEEKESNQPTTYQIDDGLQDEDDNLEPPFVIVVQGSKESGKTTLIKSLVQNFTKQKIHDVRGTITLRTNKNQRITFYECPSDMQAMIDLAKIADLALLLIDASIGFEMETFEFLCLLHNHGMPNVMGILTHLDYFKLNKVLRKTKKKMKKRFWKEVYDGAKLFYLSGLQSDNFYPKTEIHNLGRYITIQKIKPINWRVQHSYVVADRFDVIEAQDNEEFNTVSFYGYIRGTYLDKNNRMHVNGLGDFEIKNIQKIEDPCPIEMKKTVKQKQLELLSEQTSQVQIARRSKKKRSLKDKERVLYAPYSNIGAMNFEKTTGYITIPDQYVVYTRLKDGNEVGVQEIDQIGGVDASDKNNTNEGQKMVWQMQEMKKTMDDNEIEAPMLLDGVKIKDDSAQIKQQKELNKNKDDQFKIEQERGLVDKFEEQRKLDKQILFREREIDNLSKMIYGDMDNEQYDTQVDESEIIMDCNRFDVHPKKLEKYLRPEIKKLLKSKFVTGQSSEQVMKNLLNMSDSDDEKDGGEVDKKKLKKLEDKLEKQKKNKKAGKKNDSESDDDSEEEGDNKDDQKKSQSQNLKQKLNLKEQKALEVQKRKQLFMGESHGHFKLGSFVRIELVVEKKYSRSLIPEYPVVLCSLKHQELSYGYLRVKIKKHRWYPHILKNRDPIIFSVGWRKFQSLPTYVMSDEDGRHRMIKYTPKFGYCYAVFYGPTFAVGTSFIGIQKLQDENGQDVSHFRICVTGVVVELNSQFKVMKKLKLIGEPFKIHKNTAFIKGMFNSKLEVAKFQGAQIKTVSGIRGQIKKAVKEGGPEGSFRATFEDKILKSDIIFCRTWFQIDLPRFYNPIISYGKTRLLKTHSELRKDRGIAIPSKGQDSEYIIHDEKLDQERDERVFAPLQIPKAIEANLPFKSKQKVKTLNDKESEEKRHKTNILETLNLPTKRPLKKMFMNEQEKKIYSMIQRLSQIGKQYNKERQTKREDHATGVKKRVEKEQAKRDQKQKEIRKKRYQKETYNKKKHSSKEE